MMLEEMGLDGRDARGDVLASDPRDRSEFPVIVIGAGQSGLPRRSGSSRPASRSLWSRRTPESAGHGGRTATLEPGSTSEITSLLRFEPSDHWTEFFARQPELQASSDVADRHGLLEHIRFNTAVSAAAWDDAASTWSVTVRSPGR